MDLKLKAKKKQKKLYVTFRENEEEIELYNWIIEQSKVGGVANFFKLLALKERNNKWDWKCFRRTHQSHSKDRHTLSYWSKGSLRMDKLTIL